MTQQRIGVPAKESLNVAAEPINAHKDQLAHPLRFVVTGNTGKTEITTGK